MILWRGRAGEAVSPFSNLAFVILKVSSPLLEPVAIRRLMAHDACLRRWKFLACDGSALPTMKSTDHGLDSKPPSPRLCRQLAQISPRRYDLVTALIDAGNDDRSNPGTENGGGGLISR